MTSENAIGRPTKFNNLVKKRILEGIRKGAPYEIACNYAGIDYSTFANWRIRAKTRKEPDFVEFFDTLRQVEGETALMWLDKIDKAMDEGLWTAASWKLERRYNKYFSNNSGVIEMNERLDKLEKESTNGKQDGEKRSEEDD